MWRMTNAAATIFPIRHGSRLTLRNALKVVLSSEFPAFADRAGCCGLVELPLDQQQVRALQESSERRMTRFGECCQTAQEKRPPGLLPTVALKRRLAMTRSGPRHCRGRCVMCARPPP